MITVYHEAGRYHVCNELGEHFGQVTAHFPELDDEEEDELPRIRSFDLHTFMAVYHTLPDVIDFDTLNHVTVDGFRVDANV